ncbi:Murein DD-endopeptidase MepM [BD1-7 clade bacterium]|uniref:Murein DD-endopeptidase MepM n=1 Tax=BD1-7 clade bacterium TaxID=2029982 RepID=A0A5S9N2H3_9GAMM|nr:Murein DD-endopeptidase MepM [BD1-7 clade bacterium]
MKFIVIDSELSQSKSYDFDRRWIHVFLAGLAVLVLCLLTLTWVVVERGNRIEETRAQLDGIQQDLLAQQYDLDSYYTYAERVMTEQAKRAGMMEARISRVEALGGRLADTAQIADEFDFYSLPAIGGPAEEDLALVHTTALPSADEMTDEGALAIPEVDVVPQSLIEPESVSESLLTDTYKNLEQKLRYRQQELVSLQNLLLDENIHKEQYLAGKPVSSGWLSSKFGKRIDPFHGRVAWHKGVDFAGDWDSPILAVASGVVVWSGERYGYGDMVEIDHGNGYATRYGHNRKNLVKLGDVVTKGQQIAEMGSSGRSTGPHVHFEVLKNGKQVNPRRYIYRKAF